MRLYVPATHQFMGHRSASHGSVPQTHRRRERAPTECGRGEPRVVEAEGALGRRSETHPLRTHSNGQVKSA